MASDIPANLTGDKLKKAIIAFSEILEQHPEKSRSKALNEVEIRFDLTPRECQFLHDHFSNKS